MRTLLVAVFTLALSGWAQDVRPDLDQAKHYQAAGDYRKAAEWFEKAAKQGSGEAAYDLAMEYSSNRLPPTRGLLKIPHPDPEYNWNMTRVWMAQAADRNYVPACAWMGWYYEEGYRTGRADTETSTSTTIRQPPPEIPAGGGFAGGFAAGLANGLARRNAGQTTIDNKSKTEVLAGPQYDQAMTWYRKAADQNDANSAYAIGRFYEHGMGVPLSLPLATKWYTIAANLGNSEAKVRLEILSEQQQ